MNEWMKGRKDEWITLEWMDGWRNEWIDE